MGAIRLTYHNSNLRASSGLELANHLGNVLSVISDKPIPHPSGSTVAYYKADILQAMDYSPFGVTLRGRNLKRSGLTEDFRFGYQGQEMDDELKGEGNSANYKYRMHDPRLGRFFAIDPLASKYPWNSVYAFSENKVIHMIELEGLEATVIMPEGTDTEIKLTVAYDIYNYAQGYTNEEIIQYVNAGISQFETSVNGSLKYQDKTYQLNADASVKGDAVVSENNAPTVPTVIIFEIFNEKQIAAIEKANSSDEVKLTKKENSLTALGVTGGNTQAGVITIYLLPKEYEGVLKNQREFTLEGIGQSIAHEVVHQVGINEGGMDGHGHTSRDKDLMYEYNAGGTEVSEAERTKIVEKVSKEQPKKKKR